MEDPQRERHWPPIDVAEDGAGDVFIKLGGAQIREVTPDRTSLQRQGMVSPTALATADQR